MRIRADPDPQHCLPALDVVWIGRPALDVVWIGLPALDVVWIGCPARVMLNNFLSLLQ